MQSIRFGISAIVICAIVALGARLQVAAWVKDAEVSTGRQELISEQLSTLRNLQDALLDLETGQRGYLITGDDVYLGPYIRGLVDFDTAVRQLAELFGEAPGLRARMDDIAGLGRRKEAELARTIQLRRDAGFEAALALVHTDEGRRTMTEFRDKMRVLIDDLGAARETAAKQELAQYRKIRLLGAFVIVMILVLVGVAVAFLSLSVRRLDELQKQREREAMHDALTGLPNRRYLHEWLDFALAAARRSGQALAILYFDLDGFKAVNDRFGHDAGDQVLRAVAARLASQVRAADFVARLGGDEFVAVLPGAPAPTELSQLIGRLHAVLHEAPIPELADGEVSASIGVAWHPADGDGADELLAAADRAMYGVKERRRAGRAETVGAGLGRAVPAGGGAG